MFFYLKKSWKHTGFMSVICCFLGSGFAFMPDLIMSHHVEKNIILWGMAFVFSFVVVQIVSLFAAYQTYKNDRY